MSGADLTRWNRAGLTRFRYVQGNAAIYLEQLREALAARFPDWDALDPASPVAVEKTGELEPLLTRYGGERGDWGWELARGLARSCHVLTEHLDAYANEGFLGTATQWENVRRLVEMLDYHPAPPASASALLVLTAKESEAGTVEKGFQVKHSPPDGGAPLVFETLEDLEIDAALNTLRLRDHDRSPAPVAGRELILEGRIEGLAVGQPVVLEEEGGPGLEARLLAEVEARDETTVLTLSAAVSRGSGFTRGRTLIHLKPADRLEPFGPLAERLETERGLELEEAVPRLRRGQVVVLSAGEKPLYRRLTAVRGRHVEVDSPIGTVVFAGASLSRARVLSVSAHGDRDGTASVLLVAGDHSRLAGEWVGVAGAGRSLRSFEALSAIYRPVGVRGAENSGLTILRLDDPDDLIQRSRTLLIPEISALSGVDAPLAGEDGSSLPTDLETAKPKKISAGDLVVMVRGERLAWSRVRNLAVDERQGRAVLSAEGWRRRDRSLFFRRQTTVHGHFKTTARVAGWRDNPTPVTGSTLRLAADSIPIALEPGRRLLLVGSRPEGVEVEVADLEPRRGAVVITPALEAGDGFTVGNTVIRGNLVRAGHGEARQERILGSGDATRLAPVFLLAEEGVSFVADPLQPTGVRADLEIQVAGRVWHQVASLRDSAATDPHYTVRLTEEGHLSLGFGDGRHGRRLPTGTNNVRAMFRHGTGLAGNLPAGSLTKAVRPHRLVEEIEQPRSAAGGNDLEDAASLRRNAPPSVLTLERAVSLSDFGRLAARQSSVWQARAFSLPTGRGRHDNVEVVVIPAGGNLPGSVDNPLGDLRDTLEAFLIVHSLPGVEVRVSPYRSRLFDLRVVAQIKSAEFDPAEVLGRVRSALFEAFDLSRRRLGQDLFLSEIFEVVEGVLGVESSRCVVDRVPGRERLQASPREVIFLDPRVSAPRLEAKEFEL